MVLGVVLVVGVPRLGVVAPQGYLGLALGMALLMLVLVPFCRLCLGPPWGVRRLLSG